MPTLPQYRKRCGHRTGAALATGAGLCDVLRVNAFISKCREGRRPGSRRPSCRSRRCSVLGAAWAAVGWFAVLLGAAWTAKATPEMDFFEAKVRPLLIERCYECHSAESAKVKGGLRVDLAEGLRQGGDSGKPAVVPGELGQSLLLRAISHDDPDLQMPPKKRLAAPEIAVLTEWVRLGAPDPRTNAAPIATAKANAADHWAFQPVRAQTPPAVQDAAWPATEIDRFILALLEANQLRPAPSADRRTLLRRAYFVLHGLPPSPKEAEEFLEDNSPEAFRNLVDRLLASPRYGERWARHWLDVARYSDTKGYVYGDREEGRFAFSHTYRDWVVRAYNSDLPYDRFLKLQIAADQLNVPREDLAAMGFLTLGRRFLGVVHDVIDDRIDVLTRGTQGLTVACARCHDHKFDPIGIQEYYSLYGVFQASTENMVPAGESAKPAFAEHYLAELKKRTDGFESMLNELREGSANKARARTTDYLLAQKTVHTLPSEEFYEILDADELNPIYTRQWQNYLTRAGRDFHPVFVAWHRFATLPADQFTEQAPEVWKELREDARLNPAVRQAFEEKLPGSMDDVARVYGKLLEGAHSAWQAARKETPGIEKLADPAQEALRQVLYAADAPVHPPAGGYAEQQYFFDEGGRVRLGRAQKEVELVSILHPGALPQAGILEDRGPAGNPRVFKRGNPSNRAEEVPRAYPAIGAGGRERVFAKGSGRREMAEIIADPANPLTARVMVNRAWHHHFGAGLVKSTSDFGTRADPPSHPELLDYLAGRFVAEGWSLKKLHREIMLSRVWQQANDEALEWDGPGRSRPRTGNPGVADPENRLLWRIAPRRLDFESTHDYLLAVSGELSLKMGGPGAKLFDRPPSVRRAIYGYIDRQFLPAAYRAFDFANPDLHIPRRHLTTVPQQALFFMNSPFVIERAQALAARASRAAPRERVAELYELLFQRAPSERELSSGLAFIEAAEATAVPPTPPPAPSPWSYGYGAMDPANGTLKNFTAFSHFSGGGWQGSDYYPDPGLGWLRLEREKGHPGDDLAHAVVRRWTAPFDATVRVSGQLEHPAEKGDGIRAHLLHRTPLAAWFLKQQKAETVLESVRVKKGDTLDFVVDLRGTIESDDFTWSPAVAVTKDAEKLKQEGFAIEWKAASQFSGPAEPPVQPLQPWPAYAQALLFSNEFMFVD